MKDIGLATFIACVGLASGPQALTLIAKYGVALPLLGVAIAVVPACVSLFVGRKPAEDRDSGAARRDRRPAVQHAGA